MNIIVLLDLNLSFLFMYCLIISLQNKVICDEPLSIHQNRSR